VLATVPRVALPALKVLITGAETCPPDLVEFWSAGRRMVNAYGPTEATCDVSFALVGRDLASAARSTGVRRSCWTGAAAAAARRDRASSTSAAPASPGATCAGPA